MIYASAFFTFSYKQIYICTASREQRVGYTKVMCTKSNDHESSEKNKNKVNERNDKNDETYDNEIENDDSGKRTDDSINDSDEKDGTLITTDDEV